jgi:hypothetical protein
MRPAETQRAGAHNNDKDPRNFSRAVMIHFTSCIHVLMISANYLLSPLLVTSFTASKNDFRAWSAVNSYVM